MTETASPKLTNAHVLATAAAMFIPMAILVVKGLAPLFALAAVAVLALELVRRRRLPLSPGPVLALLAALAAWALVSWFWSIAPDETVMSGLSLALTFLGGAVLISVAARFDARERRIFDTGLIVGGAVGFALIAFEFATDAWLALHLQKTIQGRTLYLVEGRYTSVMNPGLAATALFVWSWALAVRARYPAKIANVAIAVGFGLILLCDSDAIVAGLIIGAVVFGAALALPRAMPWVLAAVTAVGIASAPVVPDLLPNPLEPGAKLPGLSMSAAHRIIIWKNTVPHIEKNPIIGGGFDTARALYGAKDKVQYRYPKSLAGQPTTTNYEPIPLHPHNGVLQVWLELGAVGAMILLALLLALLRAVAAAVGPGWDRAAALGMLTTTLTIGSISFGAWQSWWLTAILLAGAFVTARVMRTDPPTAAGAEVPPTPPAAEIGGPKGPEPTRYGDWERKGRAIDF